MPPQAFDDLSEIYEAMIDWPRRLANEQGFFRDLFDRLAARRVLDVACGAGYHAALFHSWGLHVEGADISPSMIDRCKARVGQHEHLNWVIRGFDQPIAPPGTFDAAICIGNSLALASEPAKVAQALEQMLAAVRAGGAIVVHVLNLWRLPDGPCIWQKCQRTALAQGDTLITKGIHRCAGRGFVDLVVTSLAKPTPEMRNESVPFLGLEADDLARMARDAGASQVNFFGDYQRRPYDRGKSVDLIMVADK